MRKNKPVAIDLFCGVGGMSLGFEQAGFTVLAAIDSDPVSAETYSRNFPNCKVICSDVSKLSASRIRSLARLGNRQIDVLFGGPPCQGFSLIGKRRFDDGRNRLLYEFARLVREFQPSYFLFENVPGLLSGNMREYLDSFLTCVKTVGYSHTYPIRIMNALDFGVPQIRRRVVVLGYKKGFRPPILTEPQLPNCLPPKSQSPTVWDAIGDLAHADRDPTLFESDRYMGQLGRPSTYGKLLRGEAHDPDDHFKPPKTKAIGLSGCRRVKHTLTTIKRFEQTAPGTSEPISHFFRLEKQGHAPTLRAGSDRSRGLFTAARPIHPVQPRCITTREAARLHSFPDWFEFHPAKCHSLRQIGNSVPPLMARGIARSIFRVID
jgi:DNA (cytosine-5)-methyltransferase 1